MGTLYHLKIVALTSSTLFFCFLLELMMLKGPVLAAIEIKTDLFINLAFSNIFKSS